MDDPEFARGEDLIRRAGDKWGESAKVARINRWAIPGTALMSSILGIGAVKFIPEGGIDTWLGATFAAASVIGVGVIAVSRGEAERIADESIKQALEAFHKSPDGD